MTYLIRAGHSRTTTVITSFSRKHKVDNSLFRKYRIEYASPCLPPSVVSYYLLSATVCHCAIFTLTGLQSALTNRQLEEYIEKINASRPQCPVGLNTLVLPKRNVKIDRSKQPYVYLACGHVHGSHEWKNGTTSRTCPMCMKVWSIFR